MGIIFKAFRTFRKARKLGFRKVTFTLLHLPAYLRFYARLFRDRRVPMGAKLLLAGAVGYVLSPLDFIPDFIPVLGELDDLTLLLAAGNRFLAMCPPHVRREHEAACGLIHAIPVR